VSSGDHAKLGITLLVGKGAVTIRMLGAKTPVTHLPEGTLLLNMIGAQLVAFEAVRELGFASSMLLA